MSPTPCNDREPNCAYVLPAAFGPGGKTKPTYAERLACAVVEFHEFIWNELQYSAEWWEISLEDLMVATSIPEENEPPKRRASQNGMPSP